MNIGIITAASEKYANSLFSLIGSLNCNWPNHPPIVVYDLGLSPETLNTLSSANVDVRTVPPFCEHWRLHYTWKLWCMAKSEFEIILWMDAGMCILQPLDDVINMVKERGYFVVPHYQFLDYEATDEACIACGVPVSFRTGKGSIAATFIGFMKNGRFGELIEEAYNIGLIEKNIKVHNVRQRPEQSIIGLLTYKYFPNPYFVEGKTYLGWTSPRMVENQKVWLQRRQILKSDIEFFKKNMSRPGESPHLPKDPSQDINFLLRLYRKGVIKAKTIGKKILGRENIHGVR